MFIVLLFLAICLVWIEYRMADWRGGFITHPRVVGHQALLPAQRRPLIPFFMTKILRIDPTKCKFIDCGKWVPFLVDWNFDKYILARIPFMFALLVSCYWYCNVLGFNGTLGVFVFSAFYPITFMYDYLESHLELTLFFFGVAFALWVPVCATSVLAGFVVGVLAGTNRESGIVLPIFMAAAGATNLITAAAFVGSGAGVASSFYFARMTKGRICQSVMIGQAIKYFVAILKGTSDKRDYNFRSKVANPYWVGILFVIGSILVFAFAPYGRNDIALLSVVSAAYIVAISIPGIFAETRIYAPAVLGLLPAGLLLLEKVV